MAKGAKGEKRDYPENLEGFFLISEVNLSDPHFQHTVVLMVNHDKDGALGLVVNRRLEVTLGDVIPDFKDTAPGKLPIYQGGPVQPQYLFTIHSGLPLELQSEHATSPLEHVTFEPGFQMLVDYLKGPWSELSAEQRPPVHLYAGYAGWSPGQLENELDNGAWIVRPAAAKHIFRADPEEGWREALGELGGLYKIVADTDFKPSMN